MSVFYEAYCCARVCAWPGREKEGVVSVRHKNPALNGEFRSESDIRMARARRQQTAPLDDKFDVRVSDGDRDLVATHALGSRLSLEAFEAGDTLEDLREQESENEQTIVPSISRVPSQESIDPDQFCKKAMQDVKRSLREQDVSHNQLPRAHFAGDRGGDSTVCVARHDVGLDGRYESLRPELEQIHEMRLHRSPTPHDSEMRVASLKTTVNNKFETMGDTTLNLCAKTGYQVTDEIKAGKLEHPHEGRYTGAHVMVEGEDDLRGDSTKRLDNFVADLQDRAQDPHLAFR